MTLEPLVTRRFIFNVYSILSEHIKTSRSFLQLVAHGGPIFPFFGGTNRAPLFRPWGHYALPMRTPKRAAFERSLSQSGLRLVNASPSGESSALGSLRGLFEVDVFFNKNSTGKWTASKCEWWLYFHCTRTGIQSLLDGCEQDTYSKITWLFSFACTLPGFQFFEVIQIHI